MNTLDNLKELMGRLEDIHFQASRLTSLKGKLIDKNSSYFTKIVISFNTGYGNGCHIENEKIIFKTIQAMIVAIDEELLKLGNEELEISSRLNLSL